MGSKHLNLIFPQWQGGGQDLSTYHGAKEFYELYLKNSKVKEIEVSMDEVIDTTNDIFGYDILIEQMARAQDLIKDEAPDTIFTIGGGCDANIPMVSYLNHKVSSNLTVLWFDSHGDLNTPKSSHSKYFYGMPLRTLLGDGDDYMVESLSSTLNPSQVVMMGARDLDPEEQSYIQEHAIPVVTISDMEHHAEDVIQLIRSKGSKNLYLHIDLDVLDCEEFPYVPVPMKGGLTRNTLSTLISLLQNEFHIIGIDIMEYNQTGMKPYEMFNVITKIGLEL